MPNTTIRKNLFAAMCFLLFFLFALQPGQLCHAQTDGLSSVWDRYANQTPPSAVPGNEDPRPRRMWDHFLKRIPLPGQAAYPGRHVGDDPSLAGFMGKSNWPHRATSYELYFAQSSALARSVYGLAVKSGDVDATTPLDRFEKGVRGFHYGIGQVCAWFNAVLAGQMPFYTDEERLLALWLLKDGAMDVVAGKAVPSGRIHHVLGAAPGKKRSFEATLRHERLHVLWDEDAAFADRYREQWNSLSVAEKQAARDRLSAYSQSNEAQLIEEWAIADAEAMPENERIPMVGL